MKDLTLPADLPCLVKAALQEDIGTGDVTASLIEPGIAASATVLVREKAILCGTPWFDEVFRQVDGDSRVDWLVSDGDSIDKNQRVCTVRGPAAGLLTAERTALNFLQTLSGTATVTGQFVDAVAPYGVQILDTRKTIPGLRSAKKYAVVVGGGCNHRMGLYDGVLIKENHQCLAESAESIIANLSKTSANISLIEVEIESLDELEDAIESGAQRVMLDNFNTEDIAAAVQLNQRRVELEASGNVNLETIATIAQTGVDYISIGAITKHLRAIDYSMQFAQNTT